MGQQIVGLSVLFCKTMLCGIFRGPRHLCAGEKDGGGNFARRVKFFTNFAVAVTGMDAGHRNTYTYYILYIRLRKMANWFECKVRYDKLQENGAAKKVTEPYLVDALTFTEAEARITEEQRPFISGEFDVAAVKRSRIAEIAFNDGGDRWYLAKVAFITVDEKSGVEKRSVTQMLVQASDFKGAFDGLLEYMKTSAADYEIVSIAETPLMDVYRMKVKD